MEIIGVYLRQHLGWEVEHLKNDKGEGCESPSIWMGPRGGTSGPPDGPNQRKTTAGQHPTSPRCGKKKIRGVQSRVSSLR